MNTDSAKAAVAGTLFAQIVANAEETKKSLNVDLTERSIKRKLQSAHDDAAGKIDQATLDYNNALTNIDNFDVNAIVRAKAAVDNAKATQDYVKAAHKDLFGSDLS